ncbi:ankyrin repeat domain-containing protein [Candidatus Bathyarchaeota archaeon]|nr:ankyrin repeat domain-containing protein [Candidatus Bathyarchaeota archaeon]
MVEYLLSDPRVDPQRQDENGITPLSYAAEECLMGPVELLLRDPRVDPTIPSHRGQPPLSHAARAEKNNVEVIRMLLADPRVDPAHVDSCGYTALSIAASGGIVANLRELIGPDVDVNRREMNMGGMTPLCNAANYGDAGCVELLLATPGIDVNFADNEGAGPLMYSNDSESVTRLLIEDDRVLPNAVSNSGTTPLKSAIYSNRAEIVAVVLSHPGVDVNLITTGRSDQEVPFLPDGESALLRAIETATYDIVKMLIADPRFDAETANKARWPPLVCAALYERADLAVLLFEDGRFSVNDAGPDGHDSMWWAMHEGSVGFVWNLLVFAEKDGKADYLITGDEQVPARYKSAIKDREHPITLEEIVSLFKEFSDRARGVVSSDSPWRPCPPSPRSFVCCTFPTSETTDTSETSEASQEDM